MTATNREAIIKAAARALRECNCDTYDEWYEDTARTVLTAITPLIRAAALEEAAKIVEAYTAHPEHAADVAARIRVLKPASPSPSADSA